VSEKAIRPQRKIARKEERNKRLPNNQKTNYKMTVASPYLLIIILNKWN
jgi:hypothetical protein